MILYHATTLANLTSIRAHGLLIERADATQRLKAIWLHTKNNSSWAVVHTIRKHRVALSEVIILAVYIPRGWMTRFHKGRWYTLVDVPPGRIGKATPGFEFGASCST
jgi:hypothetical protein